MMKEKLYKAFKPTPERFRCTVSAALDEAQQTASTKNHLTKPARVVIAAVLILAILPTAVFGATKLIGLFAKPVDKYGVELNMATTNDTYPEYVKMNVNVPEDFTVEPNTDGLKYSSTSGAGAFSLCPMRGKDSSDSEVVGNVDSYEEITLCGHTAYKIKQLSYNEYNRVYVSFDDMNVLLLIYYDNVTDDELTAFVEGISFTEGTETDHTELWEMFDERIEDKVIYTYNYDNIEFDRDTVMTFRGFSEKNNDDSVRYTAQLTDVRVTDNVNGLDNARINRMFTDDSRRLQGNEALTDDTGKLLPRTVTVTKYGDGFNTTDEIVGIEKKEQKLILIDLTYTNLSDEDTMVNIPYDLEVYNQNSDGSYTPATDIDPEQRIFADDYCDREMLYNSSPVDLEKLFYNTTLKANETKTVTIGYRCCADRIDKAYLAIIDATSAGIADPEPKYDGGDIFPNYIFKVQ